MFILQLNDMRMSQVQILTPVMRSESGPALKAFIEDEKVERYTDGQWGKIFKKDGPLEWYNPAYEGNDGIIDVGTVDDWQEDAVKAYNDEVLAIPELT